MKIVKIKNSLITSITLCFLISHSLHAQTSDTSLNPFGSNIAKEGPITICSDSLQYNQNKNTLIYEGNVTVTQIQGISLTCDPLEHDKNIVSLWVSPKSLTYNQLQSKELEIAKTICKQQGACRYLSGEKLTVYLDEHGKTKSVQLTAKQSDKPLPVAKYFSTSTDKEGKQTNSYAHSKLMEFIPNKNLLILEKFAYVKQKSNTFSGEKITYNTKTEVVNVPKQGYQRASMTISQEETANIK
ncbi:hypothetical protein L3V79_06240 [Thiotrichales bacterium 19S9-12]|nr:hypothetical protein [Thiotrichales bacterium 19S9-11]MCF6811957.1 hypothetical protein [Thiotrichales bacterium 19S9-12]